MLNIDETLKDRSGSEMTLKEILQQPELWEKCLNIYKENKEKLEEFLKKINENKVPLRIIFTGAGTSEFVGNTIVDYLNRGERKFESIGTTSIVSTPHLYYKENIPTLLVSFARSGNSPESLAAVDLGKKIVKNFYNLAITCAKDGKLAVQLENDDHSYVLNMPEESNDRGFAMTSSFTCMLLSALLVFDKKTIENKEKTVEKVVKLGKEVISREKEITEITNFDFDRIVYLGSGPLYRLTNECRLKVLELTAGRIVTCHESSMGFRHGPKSFVNPETFIVSMLSSDEYTRKYDIDLLKEVEADGICKKIFALSIGEAEGDWDKLELEKVELEDVYAALPFIIVAQMISLITSVRVGINPDTPSESGTVNRVVKGVIIHEL